MPRVKAGNILMHDQEQGTGDPLILIPYAAADRRRAVAHVRADAVAAGLQAADWRWVNS
jgi:hypothetical protein